MLPGTTPELPVEGLVLVGPALPPPQAAAAAAATRRAASTIE